MVARPAVFEIDRAMAEVLTGGTWRGPTGPVRLRGATVDSRRVREGMLFVCCVGARVDGHDFAATAVGDGAALVLASRDLEDPVPAPVLVVADVAEALAQLATEFRRRYRGATWVGITGSNGKTTVKELLIDACAGIGAVHATAGNYNNQLGVPLTILSTPPEQDVVIVELGASGPGDIAYLTRIAQPDVGVITCIGPAHLEGFGDLLGVARGKSELFHEMGPQGHCLFARAGLEETAASAGIAAAEIVDIVRAAAGDRSLTVVGGVGCPIDGEELAAGVLLRTPVGEVQLRLDGRHNLANACLAWHTAIAAGADARQALAGLARVRPAAGRLQIRHLADHRIFDDSYNANPASMFAGLAVLARQPGARLAVLGQMGELGEGSDAGHRAVGREAARLGVPLLVVGKGAAAIRDGYREAGGRDHDLVDDVDSAVEAVLDRLQVGPTAVLVKASRSAGLDAVVDGLADAYGYAAADSREGEQPC